MIQRLEGGRVFLNYGPVQMVLDISIAGKKEPELAVNVCSYVIDQFEQLLKYLREAKARVKQPQHHKESARKFPVVLQKMIDAVREIEDETLTPMAAVAGSFSEVALEKALFLGARRVIINNGGDLAFQDLDGRPINVGIPLGKVLSRNSLAIPASAEQNISGVCTSGIGGRSFTKGVADAVVIMASSAAIADAGATCVGNGTNVEDENVLRCLAEQIDSETDIPGQTVTLKVGDLSKRNVYCALLNGLDIARKLYDRQIIKGAVLCVKGEIIMIPEGIAC